MSARDTAAPLPASLLPQRSTLGAVVPVATALLAAVLLVIGVRMTSAGIADYQTRAFLADWESKAAPPSPRAWQVALDAAQRASSHYPVANGAYLERLGYVHAWQHFNTAFGAAQAQASRQAARDAYRAAIAARPTWPHAWAALAQVKLALLELDDEFRHALAQAQRLGPWRADINRRVAETGFIAWAHLPSPQQDLVLLAASHAIRQSARDRAPLFALAQRASQREVLCQRLRQQGYTPKAADCAAPSPTPARLRDK